MLEVPALLWQLDELMDEVDFVSVGSNDLFQFAMAVDRGNARVSDRFDVLGRPFLRILRDIVRAGDRNETPVTLCGEMAAKPLSAMALLGIGFRSVSMSPTAIGPVKAMLLCARCRQALRHDGGGARRHQEPGADARNADALRRRPTTFPFDD